MSAVADQEIRSRAIECGASFCVTAPAGSGKTSLLVQRYLALLGQVERPESVVAITFTRKAAAEMRLRVMNELERAEVLASSFQDQDQDQDQDQGEGEGEGNAIDQLGSSSDFEAIGRRLATTVLDQDRAKNWQILRNSSRLRIQTIDSLCQELMQQMPLESASGGLAETVDDTRDLTRQAIVSFLRREISTAESGASGSEVVRLLLKLDNNWDQCVELLQRLLERREQWSLLFQSASGQSPQVKMTRALRDLSEQRIQDLRSRLGTRLSALEELQNYRCTHSGDAVHWSSADYDVEEWRDVSSLLLTKDGAGWRKTVDKRQGFPVSSDVAREQKKLMLDMLEHFASRQDDELLQCVQHVLLLPDSHLIGGDNEFLASLLYLLPRLAAQLLVTFGRAGVNDHTQVALAALQALGSDESPTDLALRLDYSIEHLLVDEFQDTSTLQFELVRRLTRGWSDHNAMNPGAPRTLFLVGDAQQSIYRFRQANVGLFLRARDHGVGDLMLERLDLSVNFRSAPELVSWANLAFQDAFPEQDDPQLGGVAFRPAIAAHDAVGSIEPKFFAGPGAVQAELSALCDRVEQGMADDAVKTIAVLGRSRAVLRPIVRELSRRGLEPQAAELDALKDRQLIKDLVTLCSVLTDRYDRHAWLALLRTPAVALNHADLLEMSFCAPVPALLMSSASEATEMLAKLTAAAQGRVLHVISVLHWADQYKDRVALRVWVEEVWLRLGGAAWSREAQSAADAERFFDLLSQFERTQTPLCWTELKNAIRTLYGSSNVLNDKLQVMTIHKSKGLEFDWVLMPGLAMATAPDKQELLLWDELTSSDGEPVALFDFLPDNNDEKPGIYRYLRWTAKQKGRLEETRLFYVGATRAARYLWLSGCLGWDEDKQTAKDPGPNTLLASLWPGMNTQTISFCAEEQTSPGVGQSKGSYWRLNHLEPAEHLPNAGFSKLTVPTSSINARAYGTALHRCLESLFYRSILPRECDSQLISLLSFSLRDAGATSDQLECLTGQGRAALDRSLRDPWLRWALHSGHENRSAEFELIRRSDDGVDALVVDLTFEDSETGVTWIVDYKTSQPMPGESQEVFFLAQEKAYKDQLAKYRSALAEMRGTAVRCALYFPQLAIKHEVS
ncbi:MAG: UvrD-helicase domain-containing protein [Pseudomonadota bacterium]